MKTVLALAIFVPALSFASTPFPTATATCDSLDGNLHLIVHQNFGQIRIYDNNSDTLANTISDLDFRAAGRNALQAINVNENNGLPNGVVFQATRTKNYNNGFIVNDSSGKKTILTCTFFK